MATVINKLRTHLLAPDSPFELFLRTIYHKVLSTRLYFRWQDFLAKRSYEKFRSGNLKLPSIEFPPEVQQPKISFILACSLTSLQDLEVTLKSIIELNGDNWEVLVLTHGIQSIDNEIAFSDARIRFSQDGFDDLLLLISGEFVVFCEAGDVFNKGLLTHFYQSQPSGVHADLTYYDCEYIDENTGSQRPFFKPSGYSPALLLSVNYLSRAIIKLCVIEKVWNTIDLGTNPLLIETQTIYNLCEYDIILSHIPHVFLKQNHLITPQIPEVQGEIIAHLTRQGLEDVHCTKHELGYRFTWQTNNPSLGIVILTKNNYRFLESLIPALLNQTYKGNRSIHIVDNGSSDSATINYYEQISQDHQVTIVPYPETFNYSRAINLGVQTTDSELVLLMNDDMAIDNQIWLDELVQWAIRPESGVVGGKLIRKNRTIQHAGIVMGLTDFVGHIYLNAPEHYHGLYGSVNWYRNVSAITGACQMVRREVFDEVGGYDEGYQLAFGDIAFCLKVRAKGYQNVYTPFAHLYHYEGSSRGYETPVQDALKGYQEFEDYLINDDPFFSPNLTYTRIPKCVLKHQTPEERKLKIETRKSFYLKSKQPQRPNKSEL